MVELRAAAPGAARHRSVTRLVRVRPRPAPALAAPVGARAVRRGRRIVVTWRADRPARRMTFVVEGRLRRGRGSGPFDPSSVTAVSGRGRRSFRAVLRPRRPAAVRWVAVIAQARDRPYGTRTAVVRVTP
jgi:hypothetical protein